MDKILLINGENEIVIHHPSLDADAPKVVSANVKEGLNMIPSCVIDISCNHPNFNEFQALKSHIKVEDDKGKEIFYGRMINPTDSFNNGLGRLIIFEGELAYLNDSTIRPREWHDYSVKDFLEDVLDEHNNQVEDYKKIYVGNVTVSGNLYRMANYDKTWPFLLDRLPSRLGGFFKLRKENGIKYLDYLLDVGEVSKQPIVFGENMLDYQLECDTSSIFTKLVPLGADKSTGVEDSPVGNRLTIEEVNEGKDYLIDPIAVSQYGLIEQTYQWDDVTEAINLKSKGEEYLKEGCKVKRQLQMKVSDLHEIDKSIPGFNLGDDVPIKCDVFKVDENFRIVEVDKDLLHPSNSSYTFGNKLGTLTDKQIIMENSQAKIESFFNENGLVSNYLDGTINLLSNKMRAMVESADKHEGTAILFECKVPGDLYGAMAIGTKGFMIADTLKEDGSWDWKTFGTAKGFVATLIIAGKIIGNNIEIDLDSGYVKFEKGCIKGKNIVIDLSEGNFLLGTDETGAKHTSSYSRWKASDGSMTEIGANGLMHIKGGTKKPYHFLMEQHEKTVSIRYSSNGIFTTTFQLGDDFKGKEFKAIATIGSLGTGSSTLDYFCKKQSCWVESYNYVAGTVTVKGQVVFNKIYLTGYAIEPWFFYGYDSMDNGADGTANISIIAIA